GVRVVGAGGASRGGGADRRRGPAMRSGRRAPRAPRPFPGSPRRSASSSARPATRRRTSDRAEFDTPRDPVVTRVTLHAKYVDIDGTAVHYLHTGATTLPDVPPAPDRGALLVLLHAAGSTAGMWRRQLLGLGSPHRVAALGLPGHRPPRGIGGAAPVEQS